VPQVSDTPFPAFRFRISAGDVPIGGFSECTGLESGIDVVYYREGGLNDHLHCFPGAPRGARLVLTRGMAGTTLYRWYQDGLAGAPERRELRLDILPADGVDPAAAFGIRRAFPRRWEGPVLKADESLMAVERLVLCHEGLRELD
jgi:phage tail-like protein